MALYIAAAWKVSSRSDRVGVRGTARYLRCEEPMEAGQVPAPFLEAGERRGVRGGKVQSVLVDTAVVVVHVGVAVVVGRLNVFHRLIGRLVAAVNLLQFWDDSCPDPAPGLGHVSCLCLAGQVPPYW